MGDDIPKPYTLTRVALCPARFGPHPPIVTARGKDNNVEPPDTPSIPLPLLAGRGRSLRANLSAYVDSF